MALRSKPRRSSSRRALVVMAVLALALVAASFVDGAPNPQQAGGAQSPEQAGGQAPPSGGQQPQQQQGGGQGRPGGANPPGGNTPPPSSPPSTNSPTQSSTPTADPKQPTPSPTQSQAPPSNTPTPTPDDPCKSGRCRIPERGGAECLMMEKTNPCARFVDQYLPVKLNDYFDQRFPLKDPRNIPEMQNASTFANLLSTSQKWSYLGKYADQYMINAAGCTMPNQRWWTTWICIDMLQFYAERGDRCASGNTPKICASTLDQRADSIAADLRNITACSQLQPEGVRRGNNYVDSLRNHPWRSKDNSCLAAADNEEGDPSNVKCGYSLLTVCRDTSRCPTFSPFLQRQCTSELQLAAQAASSTNVSGRDENDRNPQNSSMFVMIGLGVLAGISLTTGLVAMCRVRSASKPNFGGDTLGRKDADGPQRHNTVRVPFKEMANASPQASPLPSMMGAPVSTIMAPMGGGPTASIHSTPSGRSGSMLLTASLPVAAGAVAGGFPSAQDVASSSGSPMAGPVVMPATPTSASYMGSPVPSTPIADLPQVKVKLAFTPTQPDELPLVPGETVAVHEKFDDGWARGTNVSTGTQGFFPYTCVEEASDDSGIGQRHHSLSRSASAKSGAKKA